MRYIICYDIADDKRRDRVSRYLEKEGFRMQESVFLGELSISAINRIKKELKLLINLKEENGDIDSVHIYPLCDACWRKSWRLGANSGLEQVIII